MITVDPGPIDWAIAIRSAAVNSGPPWCFWDGGSASSGSAAKNFAHASSGRRREAGSMAIDLKMSSASCGTPPPSRQFLTVGSGRSRKYPHWRVLLPIILNMSCRKRCRSCGVQTFAMICLRLLQAHARLPAKTFTYSFRSMDLLEAMLVARVRWRSFSSGRTT
jgi:hypothetical protein